MARTWTPGTVIAMTPQTARVARRLLAGPPATVRQMACDLELPRSVVHNACARFMGMGIVTKRWDGPESERRFNSELTVVVIAREALANAREMTLPQWSTPVEPDWLERIPTTAPARVTYARESMVGGMRCEVVFDGGRGQTLLGDRETRGSIWIGVHA